MSLIAEALKAAQREKARHSGSVQEATASGRSFLSLRSRAAGLGQMRSPVMLASALLAGMVAVLIAVVVITGARKKNDRERLASAPNPAPAATIPAVSETAPALFGPAQPEVVEEPEASPVPYADGNLAPTPYPIPYIEDGPPASVRAPVNQARGYANGEAADEDAGPFEPMAAPATATAAPMQGAAPAVVAPVAAGPAISGAAQPTRATPIRPGALTITMEQPGERIANPYVEQALAAQRRGDLVNARDLYARAIALSPDNAELHNNVGALHRSLGNLQQAEEAYRRAIALDRTLAGAWSNLGVVLDARGHGREAIGAFQEAIRLDPANAATKVNLAIQYHTAGLLPDARILLEDAIRRDPSMSEAHYALARLLEDLGDRAGAVRQFNLFLTTSAGRLPELEERVRQHIIQMTANRAG